MTVTAGVASIKGTYLGDVALSDQVAPSAFTLRASGAGAPGTVDADVRVTLVATDDGRRHRPDLRRRRLVGGAIGGVGQRVLTGVAKKTAGEFFTAVDRDIAGLPPLGAELAGAGRRRGRPRPGIRAVLPGPGAPRPTPTPRSAWTRLPASRRGCSSAGLLALAGVGARRPDRAADPAPTRRALMRAFTAAAVQLAPVPGPLTRRVDRRQPRQARRLHPAVRRGHRRRARRAARDGDHRVHPGLRHGGAVGARVRAARAGHRAAARRRRRARRPRRLRHLRARAERGVVYNTSVLIDPDGDVLGRLPQDPPVLHRGRLRRRLGHPRRQGLRRATPSSAGSA